MDIRIRKRNVIFDNDSGKSIEPEWVFFDTQKVEEYMEQYPFPSTKYYTKRNLYNDIIYTHGTWWIPNELTMQQKDYIIKLVTMFYDEK